MKVIICIGSSCHLKGSRQVVEKLQALVKENHLEDKVELGGTFCMGDCVNGVNVTVVSIRNKNLAGARAFFASALRA